MQLVSLKITNATPTEEYPRKYVGKKATLGRKCKYYVKHIITFVQFEMVQRSTRKIVTN